VLRKSRTGLGISRAADDIGDAGAQRGTGGVGYSTGLWSDGKEQFIRVAVGGDRGGQTTSSWPPRG
jgi:hypothetical protein